MLPVRAMSWGMNDKTGKVQLPMLCNGCRYEIYDSGMENEEKTKRRVKEQVSLLQKKVKSILNNCSLVIEI